MDNFDDVGYWSSAKQCEALAEIESLRQQLASVANERDEIKAQARMLDRMVDERDDQLAAALAACEEREKALRWYMPMMPIEHQYRINNMLSIKPDIASKHMNRVKAEALREAAKVCSQQSSYLEDQQHLLAIRQCEKAILIKADAIEKGEKE